MNVIKVKIGFENGTNTIVGNSLISGDYASTKLEFEFDTEEGTKIFEMKNPKGEVVIAKEIEDNELLLAGVDENEEYYSLFEEGGIYTYEISLYVDGTKLTSAKGEIPVKQEQVIIDGEVVEPYLPVFDELLNEISNLNIEANKVDHTTTITITKKDGTSYDTLVLDGEKGDKGDAGAIKMQIVNELPLVGSEDTIYLVPNEGETGNNYDEYIYVNNTWEKLGGIQVEVDLTDYVKNTDYASLNKGGVIRVNDDFGVGMVTSGGGSGMITSTTKTYANYQSGDNRLFISKGTLENVLNGKGFATIPTLTGTQQNPIQLVNLNEGYYLLNGYYTDGEETYGYNGSKLYVEVGIYTEGEYQDKNIDCMYGTWTFVKEDANSNWVLNIKDNWVYTQLLNNYATKSYVDGLVGDINDALDLLNGEII